MPKFIRRPRERPREILDAALKEFVAHGFERATMEDIAAGAGITAGTIYRYFAGKNALVGALVSDLVDPGWSHGPEVAAAYRSGTARQVVTLLLNRWADQLRTPNARSLLLLISREGHGFPDATSEYVSQLLQPTMRVFERAISHGIDHGEFAIIDPAAQAWALVGSLSGQLLWSESFGSALPLLATGADPVGLTIDLLVRGIPRPGDTALPHPTPLGQPVPERPSERVEGSAGLRIVTLKPPGRGGNG